MLRELVTEFRNAIETAKFNKESFAYFERFPDGQCGNTCDILAQFLIDNGYDEIIYVCGTHYNAGAGSERSHAWLMLGDLIIDITADQFKTHEGSIQCDIPVYIGPMNEYYRSFEDTSDNTHKHLGLQHFWSNYAELKEIYSVVLKYLGRI